MNPVETILSVLLVALLLVSCTWFFQCLRGQKRSVPGRSQRQDESTSYDDLVDRWLTLALGLVMVVTVVAVAAMLLYR